MKTIAVVGVGYWGKNLVRNYYKLDALHSICEIDSDKQHKILKQYPGVKWRSDFTEILKDQEIKGVVIATPAPYHATMAKEALLAGKDVFVEKPLCLTEMEGIELNQIAAENQRLLMVGHLLWYHPAILKLKHLIDIGELGRIQYIYSNRLNLGKLRREENVLWSFAPHDISVILGLVGEMPEFIQAQGGNYLHQKIADTTVTLLNFSSGIRAHIFVSWLHPFKEQKLVVVGERKMAVFADTLPWPEKLIIHPHSIDWSDNVPVVNKADAQKIFVEEAEPLKNECQHFLDCISSRQKPRTDGNEGLQVLKILNRCQEALESSKTVSVDKTSDCDSNIFIHESSIVDADVEIGKKTKIWHFSHILTGSRIATNCNIGQNVMIGPNVTIGDNCKIQNNVSIYEGVILEDNVFCGPSMVFTNIYNPRCEFSRKGQYNKTLVRKGATLGANCTIVTGVEIGCYAFIGAGTLVNRNVANFALMTGVPARQSGWMSRYGERLTLPLEGNGEDICPHTGDRYILVDGLVTLEE